MSIFKSKYLKCITGAEITFCSQTGAATFSPDLIFECNVVRLGPNWTPWLTSEFLSVKHGKKQRTNTWLATADEFYTHQRHAHNPPYPPTHLLLHPPTLVRIKSHYNQLLYKQPNSVLKSYFATCLNVTGVDQKVDTTVISVHSVWSYCWQTTG